MDRRTRSVLETNCDKNIWKVWCTLKDEGILSVNLKEKPGSPERHAGQKELSGGNWKDRGHSNWLASL